MLGAAGCRGLYGGGLLRAACGTRFVRVLASRETDGARAATLRIGEALLSGQKPAPPPALVSALPATLAGCAMRPGRTVFLRSDLVLNSVYYLSAENILSLDSRTEAVLAPYVPPPPAAPPMLLLGIAYSDATAAEKALARFVAAYLPEHGGTAPATGGPLAARVEDGWLAVERSGRHVVLAFRCPGEALAREVTKDGLRALGALEARHD